MFIFSIMITQTKSIIMNKNVNKKAEMLPQRQLKSVQDHIKIK